MKQLVLFAACAALIVSGGCSRSGEKTRKSVQTEPQEARNAAVVKEKKLPVARPMATPDPPPDPDKIPKELSWNERVGELIKDVGIEVAGMHRRMSWLKRSRAANQELFEEIDQKFADIQQELEALAELPPQDETEWRENAI